MTGFEITVLSGMTGFKTTVLSERNRTVIPTEVGIQDAGFQSFPIDSRRVGGPDSRLRGNDEFR
ncbi:TPA: hypothetical protein ACKUKZ_001356, partial [Neisseria gonorrhoeae]